MYKITAGSLRHLVTIQSASTTVSTSGEAALSWSDGDQIYAAIVTKAVSESGDGTIKAENTLTITIRHLSTLTTKHRLKFGSRFFNIISINNLDQRGFYDVLDCAEVI